MIIVQKVVDIPSDAPAAFALPDGAWLVYEDGDKIPQDGDKPTPQDLAAAKK